jgi:hypothetical protein
MNNPKINLTEDDRLNLLKDQFVKLIIERDHPKILKRAEKLAVKYLKHRK